MEMRCSGFTSSRTNTPFFLPKKPAGMFIFPAKFAKFPTGVSFRSSRAKASINDHSVAKDSVDLMSFYELLSISEFGSVLEIKQAYKQMARKYHPDVSPPDLVEVNTKRFVRIQQAYETLSDPRRKALYDRDLAKGLHLAFSVRNVEAMEDDNQWRRDLWQGQLFELKKKRTDKAKGNMSWGARMRIRRDDEESTES